MRLIIAGSRTLNASVEEIHALVVHYKIQATHIVSGTASGIDQCGEAYAKACGLPLARFPADWNKHGRAAGMIRNRQMAENADALLLIWDGQSRGSKGMKSIMEGMQKPVFEALVPIPEKKPTADELLQDVREKVAYVKSQGQTRKHHCHWPDCDRNVPPAMWGCKEHWFKLPKRLRDRIWATYKPGQEVTMTPSEAYMKVALEVQQWIKENA